MNAPKMTADQVSQGLCEASTMGRRRFRRAARHITCTRCGRHMRSHTDSLKWLASADGTGGMDGWKCPDCLTPDERRRAETADYAVIPLRSGTGAIGPMQGIVRPVTAPAPAGGTPIGHVHIPATD